ncbi:Transcription termination/antitermination protein NusA [Geodia barretti]|uniref:Transcription termination/antitermination protein NusA n=1 Tax=Geodia barretti TaxID=519541 RepID=A0AA35WI23_GEOBA|nr:Transcription termination/antitermination protein NusA [Geodia barretti]
MAVKSDFLIALTQLAAERHLPKEQVLQAIEVALASAFKKDNPVAGQNITVTLNPNTGDVSVFALKTVVEDVEDTSREISLQDAMAFKRSAAIGDEIAAAEPLPHNASRIAAQTAKQVVLQRLREAERELLYEEFLQHRQDIITGIVEQLEPNRSIVLDMGRAQAVMPADEQVPTERYKKGQRIKVFVLDVRNGAKGPEILVSRSDRNMLKRLFEIEVPEVYNGTVEIKAISRDAGFRSKVAVHSTQDGVDPVGACIGLRGNRIQSIVNELQGEKIDVVPWEADPRAFIAKSVSPSEVVHVELDAPEQTAIVVVPDRQLSLAIGKEGQNARLAARLVGWRLDIKGLTEWEEIKETRQRELEERSRLAAIEAAAAAAEVAAESEAEALEAVAEAEAIIADTDPAETSQETVAASALEEAPSVAEESDATAIAEVEVIDEEALLEALIRDEEEVEGAIAEDSDSLSVDALASFTLDGVMEEDDEEAEEEELFPDLPEVPILTPDAGKIRFAEDLVGESRGGGRGGRRRNTGGGAGRGARRGGGR